MKEKIIEMLELPADTTEDQIIAIVTELKTQAKANAAANAREKKIRDKMVESGGALDRENAIMVIEQQEGLDF